jgi:hypothetical protein
MSLWQKVKNIYKIALRVLCRFLHRFFRSLIAVFRFFADLRVLLWRAGIGLSSSNLMGDRGKMAKDKKREGLI